VDIRKHPLLLAAMALAVLVAGAAFAACGSDESIGGATTTAASAVGSQQATTAPKTQVAPTPKPTVSGDAYPGPAPKLGGNITSISPTNGQAISQLDSQSPNQLKPRGVCFEADFTGLPESGLWFQMVFDRELVTEHLTWLVASRDNPTGGRACYAPEKGFTVGRHFVAVSVQNPNNFNEPQRQLISWAFEVKP
jgi:hypothetical protein